MYTLKTIYKNNLEQFIDLGDSFTLINPETSPREFKRTLEITEYTELDGINYFIVFNEGRDIIPLWKSARHYIKQTSTDIDLNN